MKLKTKIIAVSSVIIFFALALSNFAIFSISKNVLIKEKISNEKYKAISIIGDFQKYCASNENIDKQAIQYYLKGLKNDYLVCFTITPNGPEEYFNRTKYTIDDILSAEKKDNRHSYGDYIGHFTLDKKRKIYAFNCESVNGINLYCISDFHDVYSRIELLIFSAILTSIFVFGISVAAIYYILKFSFKPLAELSEKAQLIAGGDYSKRINIKIKDEVGSLSDDFNKMAEAIEMHNNQLESEAERRLLFIGNLTHELKTPLTAIQGYSETMLTAKLSAKDEATALMYINSECKRLNRLSKKMMGILELNNEVAINLQNTAVNKLFSSVYDACIFSARQKNVEIEITNTELTLFTDLDLMTDVLVNLCDNAIKASYENGKVKIYTSGEKIVIEDFGCGIPKDEIDRITEPFYRVDKSRSRKNGGSGLGLYLTALIIDKLNMKLDIETEVGKGTKMIIYNSFKS